MLSNCILSMHTSSCKPLFCLRSCILHSSYQLCPFYILAIFVSLPVSCPSIWFIHIHWAEHNVFSFYSADKSSSSTIVTQFQFNKGFLSEFKLSREQISASASLVMISLFSSHCLCTHWPSFCLICQHWLISVSRGIERKYRLSLPLPQAVDWNYEEEREGFVGNASLAGWDSFKQPSSRGSEQARKSEHKWA